MAIDYGKKRTGLAVTDPVRIIATALTTVATPTLLPYLKDYCAREEVDIFVVGEAKHMEVARVDERFTSKIAFQTMIDSGLRKKQRRDKGMIDQIAATIILQSYMSTINNRPI